MFSLKHKVLKQPPKVSNSLARYIDKPRLDRKSEWYFMVPEGNTGTHGHTQVFISRERRVTDCHVSSNLMEKLDSLTWTQKLLQDEQKKKKKIQHGLNLQLVYQRVPVHPPRQSITISQQSDILPGRSRCKSHEVYSYGQLLYPLNPSE